MHQMRLIRNLLIVAAIAAVVAFAPGGGGGADAVLAALTMAFLAALVSFAYMLYRENQLTMSALGDGSRALLFGSLGFIALLIAWQDEAFRSGGGTLAWIVLLGLALAMIWRIWLEATNY
jgi:hypothetical protein